MSLEILIQKYGYLAIFIGALFEGESILIIGGFVAHRGYLMLFYVILTAFIGTFVGDQFFFIIGRLKGREFLDRHPKWRRKTERTQRLLEKYQTLIIFGFRFINGIRMVTPFVLGMSDIKAWRFLYLNILSAIVWSIGICAAGYFFGVTLSIIMKNIKSYELIVILAIAVIGLVIWGFHFFRNKKRT
jgi:membrane protein DedA with SNARE-associated domain